MLAAHHQHGLPDERQERKAGGGGELVQVTAAGNGEGVPEQSPDVVGAGLVRARDWPPFIEPAIIAMTLSRKP